MIMLHFIPQLNGFAERDSELSISGRHFAHKETCTRKRERNLNKGFGCRGCAKKIFSRIRISDLSFSIKLTFL